ncbi:uncharacterized protein (PEP-CTERM system associated) [Paucimonas lemoignei]|uniref:Uncharacterized protein (PEP-CTERM system associated) n=1 Tax=Paucimonas lemoignei TaxID=29443 RepID=A0A4R3HZ97_PAULE|nr:TIGR03016 family PEP-CTERM system-associated outer membrane protein [Paucimonas lemoignei]TCS38572.1 uncharacterized protein (PEP-CTERM system associated) [Paucimonas lemoignei]
MDATTTRLHQARCAPPLRMLPLASAIAAISFLTTSHAHAAEWKFTPSVGLAEIYTDNLRLSPVGTERSEFITQVTPGFSLVGNGPRLKAKINYEMQNFAYARQGSFHNDHQFLGAADAELVEGLFFLNGRASLTQQTISPFDAQATSNANLTGNRTDVRTYSVSPFMRHHFGNAADAELRYTHDSASSTAGGLLDSTSNSILVNVNSGSAFQTLGWGWQYSRRDTDYDNANTLRMEETSAKLRYLLTSRFALTAATGYERSNYVSIGDKPQGVFWQTGFAWAPSARTNLEASAGHRYYGKSFSLLGKHRTRNTTWSIGYDEQVTTTQSQFLIPVTTDTSTYINQLLQASIPDAAMRQQAVDAYIRGLGLPATLNTAMNTLTNRVFLEKRWQASAAVNGAKNTLLLSLFDINRTAQTSAASDASLLAAGNLAQADNTHQIGVNALWNWHPTSRTNVTASAGISRSNALATGEKTITRTYQLALNRQLQPKLRGTLEYRRLQQDFNEPGRNVRENAVTASFLMTF